MSPVHESSAPPRPSPGGGGPLRLHLGCGEVRLDGYWNVDQPPEAHTVQTRRAADQFAELTTLRYPAASVDEVRLHHVFEHFPRPTAIALAASWRSWLRPGGILHVEVPDFERTARSVLRPLSSRRRRLVGIRHLFGSHEAPWAAHWEGWMKDSLTAVFRLSGVEVDRVERTRWKDTHNLTVIGRRTPAEIGREQAEEAARTCLLDYLVDDSPTEMRLLDTWMEAYRAQVRPTWAT
jgi:predicted SAM-dependent methyltransferase